MKIIWCIFMNIHYELFFVLKFYVYNSKILFGKSYRFITLIQNKLVIKNKTFNFLIKNMVTITTSIFYYEKGIIITISKNSKNITFQIQVLCIESLNTIIHHLLLNENLFNLLPFQSWTNLIQFNLHTTHSLFGHFSLFL